MSTPRRMVVVDDDPKVRLLLERAFRAPEFETHTFASGEAALRRVARIRPDCVVSDILMPDMDGESFLRGLRTIGGLEHVPFVAVSAVRSEARIQAVLAAGADAFLLKPFPLRDLLGKVRSLLERPAVARSVPPPAVPPPAVQPTAVQPTAPPLPPEPPKTGEYTSPTRPVYAVPHTMSTAAIPRKGRPAATAPPVAPTVVRVVAPARVVTPAPPTARPAPPAAPPAAIGRPAAVAAPPVGRPALAVAGQGVKRVEMRPVDRLGFGRYTRVEAGGRSFVVLTEATTQPKFTVTTVITEREVPLRKIETALPHPLAREDDRDTIRRQLDEQHDDVLQRLDHLVLDQMPRRVVWSDQSRSVDGGLLAWAMSAVAQVVEAEAGTDETTRLLQRTREAVQVEEDGLRAFHVTPLGRVVLHPDHSGRLPRRAVRAVATWCHAFATGALDTSADKVQEPVRQATRRHGAELERLGFYDRLQRRVKA